jgi:prolyl oligopeptidase PreP (S9A serine peptidase family)
LTGETDKGLQHNCFDDFIAATQYLEEHKYVGKGRVAINGGSNGGKFIVRVSISLLTFE